MSIVITYDYCDDWLLLYFYILIFAYNALVVPSLKLCIKSMHLQGHLQNAFKIMMSTFKGSLGTIEYLAIWHFTGSWFHFLQDVLIILWITFGIPDAFSNFILILKKDIASTFLNSWAFYHCLKLDFSYRNFRIFCFCVKWARSLTSYITMRLSLRHSMSFGKTWWFHLMRIQANGPSEVSKKLNLSWPFTGECLRIPKHSSFI